MGHDDLTKSIAVTISVPPPGVTEDHYKLFTGFLHRHADQWEIFEEDREDGSPHIHARVLLKRQQRMDKVKDTLIRHMKMVLSQKKVLQRGIKWLYDDWEYMRKDDNCVDRHITDESSWEYADPDKKTVKKKNAWILYWLSLIDDKLHGETDHIEVERLLQPHILNGELELGMVETFLKKCKTVAYFHNAKLRIAEEKRCDEEEERNCENVFF